VREISLGIGLAVVLLFGRCPFPSPSSGATAPKRSPRQMSARTGNSLWCDHGLVKHSADASAKCFGSQRKPSVAMEELLPAGLGSFRKARRRNHAESTLGGLDITSKHQLKQDLGTRSSAARLPAATMAQFGA
jgi:hypothetical protein